MKTTVDIPDELYSRARKKAEQENRTFRSLLLEGLRLSLHVGTGEIQERFQLADRSVGDPGSGDPLVDFTWPELRDETYGGR